MPHLITLLTDFGSADSYVAQMKGVILGIAPGCTVVDAIHEIPPQDILAGALALREFALFYPEGTVHVAVVDPGVGTERRIIAAEICGRRFILPDNGLIGLLAVDFGVDCAFVLERPQYWLPEISRTFHGRDMMAPTAAYVAQGLPLSELGRPAGDLQQLVVADVELRDQRALATVISVDRFGNVITNLSSQRLADLLASGRPGPQLHLSVTTPGGTPFRARASLVNAYGEAARGTLVALVGSQGRVELAVVEQSAAARLGVKVGQTLCLESE